MSALLESLLTPAQRQAANTADCKGYALAHYSGEAARIHRYETVICGACNGSGEDAYSHTRCCRFCGGSGETEQELLS